MNIINKIKMLFSKPTTKSSDSFGMIGYNFPSHTNGHPIRIESEISPVVVCLEKALNQIPVDTTLKSVELHWPHSDTRFIPLIVVNCANGTVINETFSLFESNTDFVDWTSRVLFELIDRKGYANTLQVSYDCDNAVMTFSTVN